MAACEFLPHIANIRFMGRRGKPFAEKVEIQIKGAHQFRAGKITMPYHNLRSSSRGRFIGQPKKVIRVTPRRQMPLRRIRIAYLQYGYRINEIADHVGVHATIVGRRVK